MTYSTRTMRAEDWAQVYPEFQPHEFRAPKRMGYEFMLLIHRVRIRAGVAMKITSSVRNRKQNVVAGGADDSAHMDPICESIDVDPVTNEGRFRIMKAAMDEGFVRIGMYPNGSLHFDKTEIDNRRPAPRLWIVARPKKK